MSWAAPRLAAERQQHCTANLQALSEDPCGIFAVVLSPARELAAQIADQFVALGSNIQIRVAIIVAGQI